MLAALACGHRTMVNTLEERSLCMSLPQKKKPPALAGGFVHFASKLLSGSP